jgi:hypothetical protein
MEKIMTPSFRRRFGFGLLLAAVVFAAGIGAQEISQTKPPLTLKKPDVAILPDFEVVDIDFTLTHRVIAKIRNNSPAAFQGNVEMGLQFGGYGLVYRNRVFNLNLPAKGQIVEMEMPCDLTAEQMRMEQLNMASITVAMDSDNKIPELNENNNGKNKTFPLGIMSITLTLVPDSYNGVCNASTTVKTNARIAFRCNMQVTEKYKIILEYPQAGYRKEFQDSSYVVSANPGTRTENVEITFPTDIATSIQHGRGQMSLRVELFDTPKKMSSNTAAFIYNCQ